jgi:hypothetical protein
LHFCAPRRNKPPRANGRRQQDRTHTESRTAKPTTLALRWPNSPATRC